MWNNPGKIHFYDAFFSKVIQKLTDTCIGILVGECKQGFRYNASFIYREEGKFSGLSSDERTAKRQLVVKPLVDAFFAYLKQNSDRVSKSVKIKEAFAYALNQERYLRVFLENGDVPMDNNASERAIRGFCIGKKN